MVCRNCVLVKSDALVDDDGGGVFECLNQMVSEQTRTDNLPIIISDALRSTSIEVTRRSLSFGTLINYESGLATQSARK